MEQKKNPNSREENNGQRISVRPGNFTPPGAPAEQKGAQGGANQSGKPQGGGHHRGRRGGRNRRGGNKPQQQGGVNAENRQSTQNAPVQKPQTPANKPQNNQNNQNNQGNQGAHPAQGGKSRRNRGRRGGADKRQQQVQKESPALSETLRRELDEEFSTPTLTPVTSFLADRKKETKEVLDSEEFAVDIATASYLVDDVPCGFPIPDGSKAVEVVGVRFRSAGRIYCFAPNGLKFSIGDRVIVDTARGNELGDVVMLNRRIAERNVVQPLRAVIRLATKEDEAHERENQKKEVEALKICAERIKQHKLDMRLVDAQYVFDNSKLLFYFTSEGRVDFRELVRDLAGCFHTRIELRQIGIRDESRLIGGLGMCGRPFCCSTFLSDFGQVSVKMAKEQGLSINASKISGCCGRLMCCLRYEQESYHEEAKLTPKKDTVVITPDGRGTVVDSTPLTGMVKVKLDAPEEEPPRTYHRDTLTVISRGKGAQNSPKEDATDKEDESAKGNEE